MSNQSINSIFTGNPNVDILILAQVNDQSLTNTCQVDKYAASLYSYDMLWFQKVRNQYPNAELFKSKNKIWRTYYIELSEIKNDTDPVSQNIANMASRKGYLDILKWLACQDKLPNVQYGVNGAAENGHLEVLKWLAQKDIIPNVWGANNAAMNGHLEILKWLAQRSIVPSIDGAEWAAEEGHLEVLEWLGQKSQTDITSKECDTVTVEDMTELISDYELIDF